MLFYSGLLEDFGFYPYGIKPSAMGIGVGLAPEKIIELCELGRFSKEAKLYDYAYNQILMVDFPTEFTDIVMPAKKSIETAQSFQEAISFLKELSHSLPLSQNPEELELFHSTHLSPGVVASMGLYSPVGFYEQFGKLPPKIYGQISGDGICTTPEPQEESVNFSDGKEIPCGTYRYGKSQYQIKLKNPKLLLYGLVTLSIVDWYIKLRHDFELDVYQTDSMKSHDIASPMSNRMQGLKEFHKDMEYDIIETGFEYLVKKKHIPGDMIECYGSFQ